MADPRCFHISAGASAAERLAGACESSLENRPSLQLEVVRDLARDLERHLEGFAAQNAAPDLLADAAQKCADLATLAACNAGELDSPSEAAETVRLAAGATGSLSQTLDADIPSDDNERHDLIRRDARGASWKASLAARQFEELYGGRSDFRGD